MSKRGQLTILIILGVLVFAFFGILYLVQSLIPERLALETEESRPLREVSSRVESFVTSCLSQTAEQALLLLGRQGGYYFLDFSSTPYTILNYSQIPLYFYNSTDHSPRQETIESELGLYIDLNLDSCLKNFSVFPYYQIETQTPFTTASIIDYKVLFDLNYPLTINRQKELSRFRAEIPSRLNQILFATKNLLNQTSEEKGLCLTCFIKEGYQNQLDFEIVNLHHDFIVKTTDPESRLDNQPYQFYYAYRFDWSK